MREHLVVISLRPDFSGAGGREDFLRLEHDKTGGETVLEFLGLRVQRRLGVGSRLTRRSDLAETELDAADEIGHLQEHAPAPPS